MKKRLPIVALVGRANVGKSSLFNTIIGSRQTIVAREAGTTRDSIWERTEHRGHHFWLIDTAGMKAAEDEFELTIQDQISEASHSADVIWVVIEADTPITSEDRRVAKTALKSKKPVMLVVNKADKAPRAQPEEYQSLGITPIILTSTTQKAGIDDLLDILVEEIPKKQSSEPEQIIHASLIGRPNVGKSSLFNALAKKQQALVAAAAGTTRDINKALVRYEQQQIEIADTAGIRKPGKIERGVEKFSVLRSIAAIEAADVCLLVIDAHEPAVALEQKIAGMVKEANRGLILVISKWDSVDKDAYTRDEIARRLQHEFDFVPWAPLIFTSSVDGQNVTKLFSLITETYHKQQQRIKTPELNRWLREVCEKHPPAGLKNSQPRLQYMIQEDESPTNFKVFGKQTRLLHWSYKRFMEREFRERFGYEGVAIRFWFFDGKTKQKK